MIPKGGKYAKSVVNFVHKAPQNWVKFKSAIQQITDILKQGKLRLDGKQKTIFESNKNILKTHEKVATEKAKYEDITKKMWKDRKEFPPFNTSKEDFTINPCPSKTITLVKSSPCPTSRPKVQVNRCVTTSTVPAFMALNATGNLILVVLILSASPKTAAAIARQRSISKPTILPCLLGKA